MRTYGVQECTTYTYNLVLKSTLHYKTTDVFNDETMQPKFIELCGANMLLVLDTLFSVTLKLDCVIVISRILTQSFY